MAQTYSDQREGYYEGGDQGLDLAHYFGIAKRRAFYFIVPFILVLLLGAFVTAIQRPIYEAKGKILVESQEIPTNLVMPTVTESANQRIQVIQQRIMTRDNLLALVKKYGMFAREQQWMSGTELLDLMRERTKFDIVDSSSQNAIAFTVSFEYENPSVTLNVTNDFLTLNSCRRCSQPDKPRNRNNRVPHPRNRSGCRVNSRPLTLKLPKTRYDPATRPANWIQLNCRRPNLRN